MEQCTRNASYLVLNHFGWMLQVRREIRLKPRVLPVGILCSHFVVRGLGLIMSSSTLDHDIPNFWDRDALHGVHHEHAWDEIARQL